MSRILTLNPPVDGLSTIVNVLKRVGPNEDNDSADVRVVQRLIQMAGKGGSARTKSIGLPSVTGHFDAATGFWIYHLQAFQKKPGQIVDGVVSPAHGAAYGPHLYWAIVLLNDVAKRASPAEYQSFVATGGST